MNPSQSKAIQLAVEAAVKITVAWSQFAICGIAAVVLLAIWMTGYRDARNDKIRDAGIAWFAGACGVWGFVGLFQVVRVASHHEHDAEVLRTLLSIANSVCLIWAGINLEVYKTAPPKLLEAALRITGRWLLVWTVLVIGPPIFVLGMFGLDKVEDVLLSVAILGFLIHGFRISFTKRHFPLLAYTSMAVLLLLLVAQIPELSEVSEFKPAFDQVPLRWLAEGRWTLQLVSKVMFILLYISLTFSWMHNRSTEGVGRIPSAGLKILAPTYSAQESKMSLPVCFEWCGTRTFDLEGRLYHRILELALMRVEGTRDGWVKLTETRGAELGYNDRVRQDFSQLAKEFRFDPVVDSRSDGKEKRLSAQPEDIFIEIDKLLASEYAWTDKDLCIELKSRLKELAPKIKVRNAPAEESAPASAG